MMYPNYYYPQMQQSAQNTSGFVSVRNENEARNYPVAFGNSITFKDENAPYVYTKTMGFSQLETPRFEKYRLVKEDTPEGSNLPEKEVLDITPINNSIDTIKSEIGAIWNEIEAIKKKQTTKPVINNKKEQEDEQ